MGSAFVKVDAIVLQGVDEHFYGTGNFPLGIGIFHAQEQHAAALVRHPLGGQTLYQIAQMDKAGGRGSHTGDDCAFGILSGREFLFQHFSPVKRVFWDTINRLVAITFYTALALTCMRHGWRLLEQKAVALSLGIPLFWVLWLMGGAFALMLLVIIYNINHPGREMTRP
jgi:hypothetical protein